MKKTFLLLLVCFSSIARPDQVSEVGKRLIMDFEGCSLIAYDDGTGYAIGFGNTYYENGERVQRGDRISQSRAEKLFNYIVNDFAKKVNLYIESDLNQTQFDALVSYAYNRGIGNFRKTELLQMVNNNPKDPRIKEQFKIEWGTNKRYKKGLINRRIKEGEIYFLPVPELDQESKSMNKVLLTVSIILFLYIVYDKQLLKWETQKARILRILQLLQKKLNG